MNAKRECLSSRLIEKNGGDDRNGMGMGESL